MHFQFKACFLDDNTIQASNGKSSLESFVPDLPNELGKCAWEKYIFKYDESNRPQFIKHFRSVFDKKDKDGNPINFNKPDYKLSETIYILYEKNKSVQIVKNELGIQVEKLIKRFNKNSRLISEEWSYGDEQRYRVYYTYKK
ncbi:MAG: hypothetical protein R2852_00875 [Bacteroidia bacterium]